MPITALPTRPFSQNSNQSESSGAHRAGAVARTTKVGGVPARRVGAGRPALRGRVRRLGQTSLPGHLAAVALVADDRVLAPERLAALEAGALEDPVIRPVD